VDKTQEREIRLRLKNELPFYARHCLTIQTKAGGLAPLKLNTTQLFLHAAIERQIKETGKARILVPKGRQAGTSTYIQARLFHRVTHGLGRRAFVLAHDHEATSNIFGMAARFLQYLPAGMKPVTGASNAKELVFDKLSSGYRVGTAGSKTTARSQTIQYLHASECAYYQYAAEMLGAVFQAVPDLPGTEILVESTSCGPTGMFYDMCEAAMRQETDYRAVFLPWFWCPEYSEAPPPFELTNDEKELAAEFHLEPSQLWWRRKRVAEIGLGTFRREYPNSYEEAFKADSKDALWLRSDIEDHRVRPEDVPLLRKLIVGVDPAVTANKASDETGIIVAGEAQNGHLYVFDDRSGKYKPDVWARHAVDALKQGFRDRPADVIVAERNQGGDNIEHTIRSHDKTVNIETIHEKDGKRVRAEPVSLWYKQGLVHHVGVFAKLEDEMCTWDSTSNVSPNRIDALVLACKKIRPLTTNDGILKYMDQELKDRQTAATTAAQAKRDSANRYSRVELKDFLR
jgi:hypothetical protein